MKIAEGRRSGRLILFSLMKMHFGARELWGRLRIDSLSGSMLPAGGQVVERWLALFFLNDISA